MSSKSGTTHEGIEDRDLGSIDTVRVGIDSAGRHHYYEDATDAVLVIDADGDLVAEVPLRGNGLEAYREEVAKKNECEWVVTGAEQLGEQVARIAGGSQADPDERTVAGGGSGIVVGPAEAASQHEHNGGDA